MSFLSFDYILFKMPSHLLCPSSCSWKKVIVSQQSLAGWVSAPKVLQDASRVLSAPKNCKWNFSLPNHTVGLSLAHLMSEDKPLSCHFLAVSDNAPLSLSVHNSRHGSQTQQMRHSKTENESFQTRTAQQDSRSVNLGWLHHARQLWGPVLGGGLP